MARGSRLHVAQLQSRLEELQTVWRGVKEDLSSPEEASVARRRRFLLRSVPTSPSKRRRLFAATPTVRLPSLARTHAQGRLDGGTRKGEANMNMIARASARRISRLVSISLREPGGGGVSPRRSICTGQSRGLAAVRLQQLKVGACGGGNGRRSSPQRYSQGGLIPMEVKIPRLSLRSCPNCGFTGSRPTALFCRNCGVRL